MKLLERGALYAYVSMSKQDQYDFNSIRNLFLCGCCTTIAAVISLVVVSHTSTIGALLSTNNALTLFSTHVTHTNIDNIDMSFTSTVVNDTTTTNNNNKGNCNCNWNCNNNNTSPTIRDYLNNKLFDNKQNLVEYFNESNNYIPLYNMDNFRRSRNVIGDVTRLRLFLKKLIIDKKCIDILAIGGSVTEGSTDTSYALLDYTLYP